MQQLGKAVYAKNAVIYKLLANPKRLEILNLIKHRELAVEEIVKIVGAPKANVSQHLAVLRHARLVTMRRNGLHAYYKIIDPRIVEPCRIMAKIFLS